MKIKDVVLQISGQIFQHRNGSWWVINPQRGFVPVNTSGRFFKFHHARYLAGE